MKHSGLQSNVSERIEMWWVRNAREWMDYGMVALSISEKKDAWKCDYERLVNVENELQEESLPNTKPIEEPGIRVDSRRIDEAVKDMKAEKVPGPSGIIVKMVKIFGWYRIQLRQPNS